MKNRNISGIIKYIVFIVLIVVLASSLIRQASTMKRIQNQITEKQEEIKKLTDDNNNLKQQIKDSTSDAFIEKQARTRLNMIKPGEKVIIQKDN